MTQRNSVFAEFGSQTEKDSNQRFHIVYSLQIRLPWLLLLWSLKEIWVRNLQPVKTRGRTVPWFGVFFSNLPSVSWWEQKETKVFRVLNFCFFGSSSLQPKDERMIYRRAQSMLKLPANRYSYCFRTVDGPSAILFIPDSHCFFLPGPYSLDSRDCIFEWVYSVLIAFLSIFSISPLSCRIVLHHFSNTADLKVMADSSAVPLLQCTVTLLTFPRCSQHAAVWRQLMCPTRRCSRRLRGMDFRSTGYEAWVLSAGEATSSTGCGWSALPNSRSLLYLAFGATCNWPHRDWPNRK